MQRLWVYTFLKFGGDQNQVPLFLKKLSYVNMHHNYSRRDMTYSFFVNLFLYDSHFYRSKVSKIIGHELNPVYHLFLQKWFLLEYNQYSSLTYCFWMRSRFSMKDTREL